jgi:YidC/Oxa1 family membrane protein insertase
MSVFVDVWKGLLAFITTSLHFFYGYVGDYGVAIIVLTLAMRILLIPLTVKQTKSMYEMQRIQPKIKELQAKYKKDPEKLQAETLKFYQENKVNPFGGCLPLLLQMPIFIALFRVLTTLKLDPANFWIIIPNLNLRPSQVFAASGLVAAIPYLIFIALFALSTYLPQRMATQDPQQQKIGLYMSVMMLFFGWTAPAGVLLYWVTSSAWAIGQQALMFRVLKKQGEEA